VLRSFFSYQVADGKTISEYRQVVDILKSSVVKAWFNDECEAIPGKTMPSFVEVERNYPDTYKKFTSLGPLMSKIGNGGKGIAWNTEDEVTLLNALNTTVREEGVSKGHPFVILIKLLPAS
jgi:nitrate reductase alpha subunit